MPLVEMIHDARIVPLDARTHLSGDIRQYLSAGVAGMTPDQLSRLRRKAQR